MDPFANEQNLPTVEVPVNLREICVAYQEKWGGEVLTTGNIRRVTGTYDLARSVIGSVNESLFKMSRSVEIDSRQLVQLTPGVIGRGAGQIRERVVKIRSVINGMIQQYTRTTVLGDAIAAHNADNKALLKLIESGTIKKSSKPSDFNFKLSRRCLVALGLDPLEEGLKQVTDDQQVLIESGYEALDILAEFDLFCNYLETWCWHEETEKETA